MTRTDHRLFAALAISFLLHLLPLLQNFIFDPKLPSTAAKLTAELRPPASAPAAPPPSAVPPLKLPDQISTATTPKPQPKPATPPNPAKEPKPQAGKPWTQAVREHLKKLDAAGQFYPAEAIARGLEGEVQVLLLIDEAGSVSAARVEQGSGHPVLDDAALRAVRSLKSLPDDAPRQVVLPVRFRLR